MANVAADLQNLGVAAGRNIEIVPVETNAKRIGREIFEHELGVMPSAQNLPWSTMGFTISCEVRVSVTVPQPVVNFFCAC